MTVGDVVEKCMPLRCVRWRNTSHESLRLCVRVDCHDFASCVDEVKCLSTSCSRVRGFLETRRIAARVRSLDFVGIPPPLFLCAASVSFAPPRFFPQTPCFPPRVASAFTCFLFHQCVILYGVYYTHYTKRMLTSQIFSPTVSVGRRASRTPSFSRIHGWGCWRRFSSGTCAVAAEVLY